jgi:thymidylate synthase
MIEEKFSHNDINTQVFQLLEDLTSVGMKSSPRGQEVVEATLCTLDIDPTLPIMNFPARKFNWKYFAGELAWYLKGDLDTEFIKNFSGFWENIKNPDGSINSNYGSILLNSHPSTTFYPEGSWRKPVNQLEWVYNSLVKDSYSRQAIAFLNCPFYQFGENKDFVCTAYLNFWIRKGYLDMKVQMRSNDIFFGLTYDAPWFSLIHQSMYLNLKKVYKDLKLGMYYHCADNIHYYERHFELVDKILEVSPEHSQKILLAKPLFELENGFALTTEAIEYVDTIQSIVDNPEKFSEMKYADWRIAMSSFLNIEE